MNYKIGYKWKLTLISFLLLCYYKYHIHVVVLNLDFVDRIVLLLYKVLYGIGIAPQSLRNISNTQHLLLYDISHQGQNHLLIDPLVVQYLENLQQDPT